ncbi:MAG: hypothetical protein R3C16_14045 [Hyphomonadaceae bacterium]
MSLTMIIAVSALVGVILLALAVYIITRYYEARYERTYMIHDDRGFNRALKGRTVLWNFEESVVKGQTAPSVSFVAVDPATGGRRNVNLLDPRTGAINLRPHYCAPLPFEAVTADGHKVTVDAKVQFSLNRDLLKHVYEIQDFSQALEARIQSAFRSEIGRRHDEELRAQLHDVERGAVEQLRRAEAEGDEAGEPGMALGVRFHSASFTYAQADEFATPVGGAAAVAALPPNATPEQQAAARALARAAGVLTLRPQQIDQLADVFKNRDPAAIAAILQLLDMQTRQNIAEALAASGQLLVLTPQELGLLGASAARDAMVRGRAAAAETPPPQPNGGGARPESRF